MRPLKKTSTGNTTTAGSQIRIKGWLADSVATENLFIVKQLNTKKFVAADPSDPARKGVVTLQGGNPTAEGQARIEVTPFGGGTKYVAKLQRNVLITTDNNRYSYIVGTSADVDGECTVDVA